MVSVAAMVTAFSLVGIKTLLGQRSYQSRVISQQDAALNVAKKDLATVADLQSAYTKFNTSSLNIINGSASGSGSQDGSNAKIVLDSLPSEYDFPALVSSLEKLVNSKGLKITSLTGVDDASQADAASSTKPQPVEMPFQLTVEGSYTAIQDLVNTIDHTIRPINIVSMQITGSENSVTLNISAKTFFQPAKNLNVTTKVVK